MSLAPKSNKNLSAMKVDCCHRMMLTGSRKVVPASSID